MKKIEQDFVERWYSVLEDGGSGGEEFLDFAEHSNINSFKVVDGVKCVLFENGNTYSVDTIMKETDGDKEKAIIDELVACGVDFYE